MKHFCAEPHLVFLWLLPWRGETTSSSGWKTVRSGVTSYHRFPKLRVCADSLVIIRRAFSERFFFCLNRNKIQRNNHSVFFYLVIILWTSFRQCLWISVDVHTHHIWLRFIEITRDSFRWLSRDARRHREYFVEISYD